MERSMSTTLALEALKDAKERLHWYEPSDRADAEKATDEKLSAQMDAAIAAYEAEAVQPVQAAPNWQPIETAPKDGKESLFYTEEMGQVVMYWEGRDKRWETGFNEGDSLTPSHWMPLPAAPRSTP